MQKAGRMAPALTLLPLNIAGSTWGENFSLVSTKRAMPLFSHLRAQTASSPSFVEGFEMSAWETLGPPGYNRKMKGFHSSRTPSPCLQIAGDALSYGF